MAINSKTISGHCTPISILMLLCTAFDAWLCGVKVGIILFFEADRRVLTACQHFGADKDLEDPT